MEISKRLNSEPATRAHDSFGCTGADRDRYADEKNVFAGGKLKGQYSVYYFIFFEHPDV
jgi:hypothetical protein